MTTEERLATQFNLNKITTKTRTMQKLFYTSKGDTGLVVYHFNSFKAGIPFVVGHRQKE